MHAVAEEFFNRIVDAVEQASALGRLSKWMVRHTTLGNRPFSFVDHEFQRAIVDDKHHDVCVRKPSQVGMSEIMARLTLAFLSVTPSAVAIMTLPTIWEAQRFSKSRLDLVIIGARILREMLHSGSDGSTFKQIGTSQLHMAGTRGKAIISIPADLLVCDEVDFSSQEQLTTAESRLTHSRFIDETTGIRGIKRLFSTPTVPKYGVSALLDASDQRYRLVKCLKCSHWFWPNFLNHVVVDGFDGAFSEMTHYDAEDLEIRGLVDTARLLCEKCHEPLDLSPENREWVAEFPSRASRGYAVSPFDLPKYHTPASIIRKLIRYRARTNHFRNFTLGLPYADSSNSIILETVQKHTTLQPVAPELAEGLGICGCVAGLDVGKVSWFTVGKPMGKGRMHVLYAESIPLRGRDEGGLLDRVVELCRIYQVMLLVSDAQPFTDTVLAIQAARPEQTVMPNIYSLRDRKLPSFTVNEKDWSVSSNRTKTLDSLVRRINTGQFQFPVMAEMNVINKHLQNLKRVDRLLEDGEIDSQYQRTGDDHYFHSLNYLNIAQDIVEQLGIGFSAGWLPSVIFREAEVGKVHAPPELPTLTGRRVGYF